MVLFSKLWHPPAWLGQGIISSVVQLAWHLLAGLGHGALSLGHAHTQTCSARLKDRGQLVASTVVSRHQLGDVTPRMLLRMLNELRMIAKPVSLKASPCCLEQHRAVSLLELVKLWGDGEIRPVRCKRHLSTKLGVPSPYYYSET